MTQGEMSTTIMLKDYLLQLGFTDKECLIYTTLAEIGIQPASTIAKRCKLDRVTTYKNLKRLADRDFVKTYYRNGIQSFGIESFANIQSYLAEKKEKFDDLIDEFPQVENLLKSMKGSTDVIPKLQIFEGEAGIKRFFRDILFEMKKEGIRQIRMLTSNTFDEQLGNVSLSVYIEDFFEKVKEQNYDLEIFEASGTLIPERLQKVSAKDFDPHKLPAARGTTNIFIAGSSVYIAYYKESQIGLKIKQSEVSQIFHFIFDFMAKTS